MSNLLLDSVDLLLCLFALQAPLENDLAELEFFIILKVIVGDVGFADMFLDCSKAVFV